MDDIKDIQKNDDFSRLIDAQNVRTDPFGKNRAAERLYRRTERICAALYLLTRHIPENEPVRQQVRSTGILLFTQVLELKDEMRSAESNAVLNFQSSLRKLISLVRMLNAAGFISFQNADVVIAAIDELGVFVSSSQRSSLSEGVVFTREDLLGDTSPLGERYSVKDIRDRRYIRDKSEIKDTSNESDTSRTVSERSNETRETAISSRAQGILTVLASGGEFGIKDIAARLPDYSEKMIQRELALLVDSRRIKKTGLKRWSKYSIA